ncbi:PspC domain-containing protein [Ferruginibacter sp. SUN002]|uniref:PspC domain-containing protein n=1 Tax=Ferruginibacter sp. SUN002 TaxID=2937789 RepID=UPI003D36CD89
MKQVININFHGQVVPIEVSAFDILKKYTDSLGRYFSNEEGKEEIINDIESRIGELFQERIKKGATCITDDDVNAIIRSMGRPEDFEESEETASPIVEPTAQQSSQSTNTNTTGTHKRLYRNENNKVIGGVSSGIANYFGIDAIIVRIIFVILAIAGGTGLVAYLILWLAVPSTATNEIGGVRKKLFRDTDDKFIAGVCSGIGNYFGISAWVPRIFFLLPFLSFAFRMGDWGFMNFPNFLSLSFSPGALIVYIILWLVIPEATTTAEKLEMKGEKVDLNSIKNSVMEEMKDLQGRVEEKGKAMGAEMSAVARKRGRSFGDVIVFLVKAFAYFIIGCVGFVLVAALFALAIFAMGIFPLLKEYLLRDGWQTAYAWGTLIFFISVPVIGVITWIIRRLAKVKRGSKVITFAFISLWIIGWVSVAFLGASLTKDFKTTNNIVEKEIALSNPQVGSMEFTAPDDIILKNHKNRFLRFSAFTSVTDEDTVYINNVHFRIIKSPNDSFHLSIIKQADGRNIREAEATASLIGYSVAQTDSIIRMPIGIPINRKNKFRNQRVTITVSVPVGKKIRINQSIWDRTSEGTISFVEDHHNDWEDYWGNEERGWETNVDYIMKADGLYTLDGIPAKESRSRDRHLEDDDININIDGEGFKINIERQQDVKARKLDSLERRQQIEKDSMNAEIDKKQAKEKEKIIKGGSQPSAYSSPIGLPIINSLM